MALSVSWAFSIHSVFLMFIYIKYSHQGNDHHFRTSYASVLTIVSFSMERYLAICHPLYSHTMSGFKRAIRIIGMVWFVAMLAALPYAFFTQIHYIDRPLNSGNRLLNSAFCAMLPDNIYPKVRTVGQQLAKFPSKNIDNNNNSTHLNRI